MATKLAGKVVLVTGGGKRIGRSVALHLASDGADVVVNYLRSEPEAEAVAAEIRALGRRAAAIRADVSRKAEVDEMFAAVDREFGRLDVLVNNAGIFFHAKFEDLAEEQWDHTLAVNLKSQMLCAQAAVPIMRRNNCIDGNRPAGSESAGRKETSSGGTVKGRIINMASLGGLLPWPGYTHYCVSKTGVIMLTRCLARALAPEILVNSIAPGTIQFPDDSPPHESMNDAHIEDFVRRVPLHRTGTGDDIADAVSFLAHADFITGQVLAVDGGRALV